FADPAELKALEAMVFPHIGRRAREEIERAQADPAVRFVVLDAAVMLEAGWAGACDRVVFVEAPREARVARLAARSRWTPAGVAAGIIDEAPAEAPPVAPPEPAPPARAEELPTPAAKAAPAPERPAPAAGAPPVDPNEYGFDAETNSRYEEIKRGSTFITQLQ